MKCFLALWVCCFWGFVIDAWAQPEGLQRLLESPELRHAVVGISVKSLKDGRTVADYAGDKSLQPASVCKLLPTVLALKAQGSGFRYRTPVVATGRIEDGVLRGDIVIRPQGDPCPDSRYFPEYVFLDRMVEVIRRQKIRKIQGCIRVEGGEDAVLPGSWLWEDISNYYGAGCFPFNYRDNAYYLGFRTGEAGEKAELLSVEPEQPGVSFVNEVVAGTGNGDDAWIYGGPYSGVLHVTGRLPRNRQLYRIKGAMHHPVQCFLKEIEEKLKQYDIVVEKEVLPDAEEWELAVFTSPVLKEIVRITNKKSVNLFAEALGNLAAGGNFPTRCCSMLQEMGVDTSGILLRDACGLSVANALPAAVFSDVLLWAYKELGWDFVASLPLAGTDVGLNAYLAADPALKNKLRAKTGSFTGVRCLSGYLTRNNGEVLAFTVLVNHFTCSPARLQKRIGSFLSTLL